jgi:hypothetical protein
MISVAALLAGGLRPGRLHGLWQVIRARSPPRRFHPLAANLPTRGECSAISQFIQIILEYNAPISGVSPLDNLQDTLGNKYLAVRTFADLPHACLHKLPHVPLRTVMGHPQQLLGQRKGKMGQGIW